MLLPSVGIVKALFFSFTELLMIDSPVSNAKRLKSRVTPLSAFSDLILRFQRQSPNYAGQVSPNEMFLRGSPQAGNQQRKSVSIHLATLTVLSPGSIL